MMSGELSLSKSSEDKMSRGLGGGPPPVFEEQEDGFIILETNYRVYAYTSTLYC
jgi:hypothetical protein